MSDEVGFAPGRAGHVLPVVSSAGDLPAPPGHFELAVMGNGRRHGKPGGPPSAMARAGTGPAMPPSSYRL